MTFATALRVTEGTRPAIARRGRRATDAAKHRRREAFWPVADRSRYGSEVRYTRPVSQSTAMPTRVVPACTAM